MGAQMQQLHRTRVGNLLSGLGALMVAYVLFLMAVDTARLLEYAAAFVLVIVGIRRLARAVRG